MCKSGDRCKSGDLGGNAALGFGWTFKGNASWVRNGILSLPTPTEGLGFSPFLGDKAGNSAESSWAECGIKRAEIWSSVGKPGYTFAFS
jgi:hypothetical protein